MLHTHVDEKHFHISEFWRDHAAVVASEPDLDYGNPFMFILPNTFDNFFDKCELVCQCVTSMSKLSFSLVF